MKAVLGFASFVFALPAAAQDHSMHMPGMTMPAKPVAKPKAKPQPRVAPKPQRKPAPAPPQAAPVDPHAGHDRGNMPAMGVPATSADSHAGHDTPAMVSQATAGTDLPAGDASAPQPARDRAADRYWNAGAMAAAEAGMRREHGGMVYSKVLFDLLEYQAGRGDGYRWDGEASFGGDRDRLVLKSEGRGAFDGGVEDAEVQALYGRALDSYWNLRAGIRQDLGRGPRATWAALGIEGVAPYWLELQATLFLSTRGDLLGRVESHYDQRITHDFVLQPRAELDFAAQDMPGTRAGLSEAELGLRLRYERVREFAPYLGVSWDRKRGEGAGGVRFVAGVRSWF